jgi:hypothetical protein
MPGLVGLEIARLGILLNLQAVNFKFSLPTCHLLFGQELSGLNNNHSCEMDSLLIQVEESLKETAQKKLLIRCDNWALWLKEDQDLMFKTFNSSLPKTLIINQDFTSGMLSGDFDDRKSPDNFPLQDLDIMLVVNWLATFGELLLHASGVVLDEKGYAFIGPAGEGKSTLAAKFADEHNALVLGEDNLILRHRHGRYWIYGTPWHQSPAMCSPLGAPLEKVFFLDKWAGFKVEALTPMDGITRILQTGFIPYYRPDLMPKIFDNLSILGGKVPFYRLSYPLGSDPWELIQS